MMSRIQVAWWAGTLLIGFLGGVRAQDVVKIDVSVSGYPTNSPSPPYVVGRKLGVFKQNGIEIGKLSGAGGGGQTVRNVISGELAFGDVSPTSAATAFMKGEKVLIVGGGVRAPGDLIFVSKKESPIKTIADLRGKTVGITSKGSASEAALLLALKRAGIPIDEVDPRPMGGTSEAITGVLTGALDAAIDPEPLLSKDPAPYQVVIRVAEFIPAQQQTVLMTRQQYAQENPDVVRRFLRAYAAAVDFIDTNPEAAAKAWAEETELDPAVTRKVIEQYRSGKQWSVGLDAPGLSAIDEEMRLLGLVKSGEKIPWDAMIDQQYLPAGTPKIDAKLIAGG
jgi:NitT/TauT family transport system substrate-binding protein